jgi:Flp pilus assembly protein TadB
MNGLKPSGRESVLLRPELFYIGGAIVAAYVFYEIYKRTKRVPLAISISQQERNTNHTEVKKKKQDSFAVRAERAGWKVGRNYLERWLIIGLVLGGLLGFYMESWLLFAGFVLLGLVYPHYQLRQKEEEYYDELPLKADQALGAVEQQIDSDIPIFEALKQAVPYMQEPLKSKYEKVVEKVEKTGIPLNKALDGIPEELDLSQLEYFHIILEVAQETEEKAKEIISDASETIRRQQKQATRLKREVAMSKTEMKMMFGLVCVMVGSFALMLPDALPFKGTALNKGMDIGSIVLSGWVVWSSLKKIQSKNLF